MRSLLPILAILSIASSAFAEEQEVSLFANSDLAIDGTAGEPRISDRFLAYGDGRNAFLEIQKAPANYGPSYGYAIFPGVEGPRGDLKKWSNTITINGKPYLFLHINDPSKSSYIDAPVFDYGKLYQGAMTFEKQEGGGTLQKLNIQQYMRNMEVEGVPFVGVDMDGKKKVFTANQMEGVIFSFWGAPYNLYNEVFRKKVVVMSVNTVKRLARPVDLAFGSSSEQSFISPFSGENKLDILIPGEMQRELFAKDFLYHLLGREGSQTWYPYGRSFMDSHLSIREANPLEIGESIVLPGEFGRLLTFEKAPQNLFREPYFQKDVSKLLSTHFTLALSLVQLVNYFQTVEGVEFVLQDEVNKTEFPKLLGGLFEEAIEYERIKSGRHLVWSENDFLQDWVQELFRKEGKVSLFQTFMMLAKHSPLSDLIIEEDLRVSEFDSIINTRPSKGALSGVCKDLFLLKVTLH